MGMGIEASSGIVLILRLVFFMAAIMIIIGTFEASLSTLLSITALFGTALGLAFSQALGNIVSGLYVLVTRPFRIGDYVRIGTVEGLVREITLNYTRILLPDETKQLVPNNKVVGSEVTNFRIEMSKYIEERQEEIKDAEEENQGRRYVRSLESTLDRLRTLTTDSNGYRYTFDLSIHMSYNHKEMRKKFDEVCDRWASVFLTRPIYFVWAKPVAAITYRFAFIVQDPMIIIKRSSDFMEDLLELYMT